MSRKSWASVSKQPRMRQTMTNPALYMLHCPISSSARTQRGLVQAIAKVKPMLNFTNELRTWSCTRG